MKKKMILLAFAAVLVSANAYPCDLKAFHLSTGTFELLDHSCHLGALKKHLGDKEDLACCKQAEEFLHHHAEPKGSKDSLTAFQMRLEVDVCSGSQGKPDHNYPGYERYWTHGRKEQCFKTALDEIVMSPSARGILKMAVESCASGSSSFSDCSALDLAVAQRAFEIPLSSQRPESASLRELEKAHGANSVPWSNAVRNPAHAPR
ncbi:MAG: hypothetical protein ACXWPM_03175 [Bdellovibrionota bacterium]